jgi:hypothetical protein
MLLLGLGNRLSKMAGLSAKKEKKKKTPFRSKPYPIRAREEKTQTKGFPENDYSRHHKTLEKQ